MGLKDKIFKQKFLGKQWGMISLSAAQLSIFVALANLLLNAVDAYDNITPWLEAHGIMINFWLFLTIIAFGLLVILLCLFKFALPSFWSVYNDQFYAHNSHLRKDIEAIKEKLGIEDDSGSNRN